MAIDPTVGCRRRSRTAGRRRRHRRDRRAPDCDRRDRRPWPTS